MGAKDSYDDIRKYLPDLDAITRAADPALAEEKHRKAVDNPELDRALAELKRGLKEGEAPFEFPVVPGWSTTEAANEAAWVAPSRWRGSAPAVEKAALPSALAPAMTTLVSSGLGRGSKAPRDGGRRALSPWLVSALAVLAVVGPVALIAILSQALSGRPDLAATVPREWGQASAQARVTPEASTAGGARSAEPVAPRGTEEEENAGAPAAPEGPKDAPSPWARTAPRAPARPAPTPRPIATDIMH